MAYVYFIRSLKDLNWVYIGSSSDVDKRLKEHNSGSVRSTKSRLPYELIYKEEYATISIARRREKELKLSRSKKADIIKRLAPSSNG